MSSPDAPSDDGTASSVPDPDLEASADASTETEPETGTEPPAVAPAGEADAPAADEFGEQLALPIVQDAAAVEAIDVVEGGDVAEVVEVQPTSKDPSHRRHRSWGQRLLLGLNCIVILACFVGAAGLLIGRHYGNSLARVDINAAPSTTTGGGPIGAAGDDPTVGTGTGTTVPSGPVETFPAVDVDAQNFLITGADNNACIEADSPYAGAFGDRATMGERSDTIMLMRVDPKNHRAAVLSFPRDLWVQIPGKGSKSRINSAYVRDDPQRLIDTIGLNFYLGVDHFIQVDFCAFKTIVDAVGGVTVPFEYPARDENTGLNVPEKGCFTFNGDHALAYVRSRHYEYQNNNGKWIEDPASDLGRISRQQDFLRRVLSSAVAKGMNPSVARGIIKAAQDYVVVDSNLTINRMLEFAGVLADFEPGAIATYQIESESATIQNNAVLIPRIKGENMQKILAIFRGQAELASAPEQVFETTTTSTEPGATTTTAVGTTVPSDTVAVPDQTVIGIVPPADMSC